MLDYRKNPEDSPFAWCFMCNKLLPATQAVTVMRTVFHVHEAGIFPYGVFSHEKTVCVEQPTLGA